MAVQFAFQPLVTKWFVSPGCLKTSVVLMTELSKLVISIVMLAATGELGQLRGWRLKDSLLSAGPPALTYTAQNILVQTAYQNLDGMTFNVINQTKILFNALFVFFLLGKGQTKLQMVALMMIFSASVLVSIGDVSASSSASDGSEDVMLGVLCVSLGSALSGLGAAISEKVLITNRRHTLVFSAELSALGSFNLLVNLLLNLNGDGGRAFEEGPFINWTSLTLVPIFTNAVGGLVVGLVTKLSGSVRKGIALTIGLVLSGVLRVLVSGKSIHPAVALALPLASAGICLHVYRPPVKKDLDDSPSNHKHTA